jgi:lysozyme
MTRKLSAKGAQFIAGFEGFRSHPYRDAVGVWTIGYGHTHGVGPQLAPVSRKRALELLKEDAADAAAAVNKLVRVKLSQNEFDALVSLVYNIGAGGFAKSTVLRELNRGHRYRAGLAFLMWDKAGGRTLLGLSRRRHAERRLFLKR